MATTWIVELMNRMDELTDTQLATLFAYAVDLRTQRRTERQMLRRRVQNDRIPGTKATSKDADHKSPQ